MAKIFLMLICVEGGGGVDLEQVNFFTKNPDRK